MTMMMVLRNCAAHREQYSLRNCVAHSIGLTYPLLYSCLLFSSTVECCLLRSFFFVQFTWKPNLACFLFWLIALTDFTYYCISLIFFFGFSLLLSYLFKLINKLIDCKMVCSYHFLFFHIDQVFYEFILSRIRCLRPLYGGAFSIRVDVLQVQILLILPIIAYGLDAHSCLEFLRDVTQWNVDGFQEQPLQCGVFPAYIK